MEKESLKNDCCYLASIDHAGEGLCLILIEKGLLLNDAISLFL